MEPFEKIYDVDYDPCDSDSVRGSDSSDENLEDFENEMQDELDNRVGLKKPKKKATSSSGPGEPSYPKSSDDEDSDEPKQPADGAADAAEFYDPDEDENNEKWAQRQRQASMYVDPLRSSTTQTVLPLPNSDAVLNCPGCMTVLCRDCQAHETNAGQYRAMFVSNCRADPSVEVPGPLVSKRVSRKRKKGEPPLEVNAADDMVFHPFHCNICQTRVGVLDSDEVYHFLHALAS